MGKQNRDKSNHRERKAGAEGGGGDGGPEEENTDCINMKPQNRPMTEEIRSGEKIGREGIRRFWGKNMVKKYGGVWGGGGGGGLGERGKLSWLNNEGPSPLLPEEGFFVVCGPHA